MKEAVAVLASGGLDSCVLLADFATKATVYPIYIRAGHIWEDEEHRSLEAFIAALKNPNVKPVTTLFLPIQPLYQNHWSFLANQIPSQNDPDSKTYLPGRNILLLSLAGVWCSLHKVPRIAIGTLCGNTFSDASMAFFTQLASTLSMGLDFQLAIEAPFRQAYEKEELIRRYANLPLELSMTCMKPKNGLHCGQCNKCSQRKAGYLAAGIPDKTKYQPCS